MLFKLNKNLKGQSIVEYMVLIVFVIAALLVSQKYLARSISGRWKSQADSMGYGRQYSYGQTLECRYTNNEWYDLNCYDQNECDCESSQSKMGESCTDTTTKLCDAAKKHWKKKCRDCIDACKPASCE